MGLRSDIQQDLTEAFNDPDGLFDVVESFSFRVKTLKDRYDSATDTTAAVYINSPSRGIFKRIVHAKIDNINVMPRDETLVINGSECFITPQIDMEIVTSSGKIYRVIDAPKVSGGDSIPIIWRLQVRSDESSV